MFIRFLIGFMNLFFGLWQRFGLFKITLQPEALKEKAIQRSQLTDFGPADYEVGLKMACQSFETDGNLSFFGQVGAQDILIRALESRLAWVEWSKNTPEKPALNAPIIIVGLPRTGTTLLHRLLAQFPGIRAFNAWELADPLSKKDPQARQKRAEKTITLLRALAPDLDRKHILDAHVPEEEVSFFNPSFWTPTFWRFGTLFSYLDWYLKADPRHGYGIYRDMLTYFQLQDKRRFLLKLPNHTGYLEAMAKILPEALFIQTHRDPEPVLASYLSLSRSVQNIGCQNWPADAVGAASLKLWAYHCRRNLEARKSLDATRILDIQFTEIQQDLEGVVDRIMAFTGLEAPSDLPALIQDLLAEKRNRPHGHHHYDLGDYGLTTEMIQSHFAPYIERFLSPTAPQKSTKTAEK